MDLAGMACLFQRNGYDRRQSGQEVPVQMPVALMLLTCVPLLYLPVQKGIRFPFLGPHSTILKAMLLGRIRQRSRRRTSIVIKITDLITTNISEQLHLAPCLATAMELFATRFRSKSARSRSLR